MVLFVFDTTTAQTPVAALPDDNDVVTAVVGAVADAEDASPLELDPLAKAIDPDALDALVTSLGAERTSVSVSFQYAGYLVTVDGGYDVTLSEDELASEPEH